MCFSIAESNLLILPNDFSDFMILRDIKVLDFSRLLPGPLATAWMAEAGAHVIKIEDALRPDGIHDFSGPLFGYPRLNETLNWEKEFFCKYPLTELADAPEFEEFIRSADVLMEQFKPGLMDKLGLGYESLRKRNPRLIYISLSGFGAERPEPGHDLNFLAESGLLDLMRDANGCPVIPHAQLGDITGSFACYSVVLEALLEREKTGLGSFREVNMTASLLPFLSLTFRFAEVERKDMAGFLGGSLPNYSVYRCADDEFIAVGALEFHLWNNACKALCMPEHLHSAYNNPAMKPEIADFFLTKKADDWMNRVDGKNTCISRVVRVESSLFSRLHERNLQSRRMESGELLRWIGSPFRK
jgi:crotonobetainyl-CoA:carnitine CoA-transferase CaiB-like acyl-CoA transferase